jgi:hypothetical protein
VRRGEKTVSSLRDIVMDDAAMERLKRVICSETIQEKLNEDGATVPSAAQQQLNNPMETPKHKRQ